MKHDLRLAQKRSCFAGALKPVSRQCLNPRTGESTSVLAQRPVYRSQKPKSKPIFTFRTRKVGTSDSLTSMQIKKRRLIHLVAFVLSAKWQLAALLVQMAEGRAGVAAGGRQQSREVNEYGESVGVMYSPKVNLS